MLRPTYSQLPLGIYSRTEITQTHGWDQIYHLFCDSWNTKFLSVNSWQDPPPSPPLPLPPPLCLSLNFYIPGKCCEHWIVTLIATGIISQRKPMDKRDGNEVDRHWCSAFRWRNTGEDCASILIALYLTLAFNNKRQMLNLERRESPLKGQKFCLTDETL